MRDVAAFRAILREVLSRHHSFEVEFRGVTAAPSAVMIQGFPRDGGLEGIRDDLRRAFAQRGFANRLDRRYRSATAHITAMRFAQPEADWQRLLTVLRANRQTPFGMMAVDQLQLVWGDWYGTIGNLRVLEEFPLAKRA
jgi:2'-5' RNA ligase